jgi:colanic acid/amylovoran biosynthesis glycosyltransferase
MNAWMAIEAGLSPLVASFYGFDATSDRLLRRWRRQYEELFARGQAFVAEGPAMGRRLEALGAPASRVHILPLLADVDGLNWRPPRESGPIRVIMAGRFVEKKGFVLGVEAFASALRGADATLTLMGDGPECQALHRAVERTGISDQVRFLPFNSRQGYRQLLANSDILLQPSRTASNGDCEGGAPTVLLDAQAIGVIVVGSDHADIPYVVDPSAAYLAPEGDLQRMAEALAAACSSRHEWHGRSLTGRQHVEEQHAPDAVGRRRDQIYLEACR